MMGESPTRPASFQLSPLVVVTPASRPAASMAMQLMVPCVLRTERRSSGRVFGLRREPVVPVGHRLLPAQPGLPGLLGQQVLFLEAVGPGESQGALADDQDVVGPLHDQPGHLGRVLDVPQRGHGPGRVGRPVHDRGVELDDAVLVRQPAVADRHVVRVVLDDVHAGDHGVEGIAARLEDLHGLFRGPEAVAAGHGPRPGRCRRRRAGQPHPAPGDERGRARPGPQEIPSRAFCHGQVTPSSMGCGPVRTVLLQVLEELDEHDVLALGHGELAGASRKDVHGPAVDEELVFASLEEPQHDLALSRVLISKDTSASL